MIRSLRRSHRNAFAFLAVFLPTIIILGLTARTPVPRADAVPGPPGIEPLEGPSVVVRIAGTELTLVRRDSILTIGSSDTGTLPRGDVRSGPDVLAYWSPLAVENEADLAGARLLGPMRGGVPVSYALPDSGGFLTLYSLGHGVVLGSVAVPGGGSGS